MHPRILSLFIFIFGFLPLTAEEQRVCLNMIVKDEASVIERCLASVKPFISYWVIVDTGSTDGTQELIKNTLKDVPGELHEREWVDFAFNRNQALELAKDKGDYILLIDADETLAYEPSFKLPLLDKDFYYLETHLFGTKYKRNLLINNHIQWEWKGVLHEALYSEQAHTVAALDGIVNVSRPEGSRSNDPDKYKKDARILEKALLEEPENTRYAFYLAQSYRDSGEHAKALSAYRKRIGMGGWSSEIFWSFLQVALLKEALEYPEEEVVTAYKTAYLYQPLRAEPLYRLAQFQRKREKWKEAYEASAIGLTIKESTDILFVEKWIYDYGMLFEHSITAYWAGHYLESKLATDLLLKSKDLPSNIRNQIDKNLIWINAKLEEQVKTFSLRAVQP